MLTELLGFYAWIMYRGFGPGGVQNSNSELPEIIILIMFWGSGLGGVQKTISEHLRGSIYCKTIGWRQKAAKRRVETRWKSSGPARAAGGRNSDFIRGLQISAGILSLDLTRLEPRWGRRIASPSGHPPTLRLSHNFVLSLSFIV